MYDDRSIQVTIKIWKFVQFHNEPSCTAINSNRISFLFYYWLEEPQGETLPRMAQHEILQTSTALVMIH